MTQIKDVKEIIGLGFRVHTANLLQDIVANQIGHSAGVLQIPLNQFQRWISILAERATELNDPELNIICLSMGLYEIDPKDVCKAIENQIEEMNKNPKQKAK